MKDTLTSFKSLCEIIAQLRDPEKGCPWDIKQTHTSLKPYLLEEAYELLEAIDQKPDQIKNELGDVLLQVMLHAQVASDNKHFDIKEVINLLNTKLIERHPHVFGNTVCNTAEEVAQNWNKLKKEKNQSASSLGELPPALPALLKASLLGKRAKVLNFDWSKPEDVLVKVQEELKELEQAIYENNSSQIEEEIGDLLFAISQLARKLNTDPEDLLQKACKKFTDRFNIMEKLADTDFAKLTPEQQERLWQKAKQTL